MGNNEAVLEPHLNQPSNREFLKVNGRIYVLGVTIFAFSECGMRLERLLVLSSLSISASTSSQSVVNCVSIWCAVDNAFLLVRYTDAGKLSCH